MHITLSPLGRVRFRASIDGSVLGESRTPLFDADRTLSREGATPETILSMSHETSLVVSMVSTVGEASRFTVIERDDRSPIFESYRPHPSQDGPVSVAAAPQAAIWGSTPGSPPAHRYHQDCRR
jgi:hypothetical protein